MDIERLVEQINEQYDTAYILGKRYTLGEQGAYQLLGTTSQQYVLKWHPDTTHLSQIRHGAEVTRRLRAIGYPAPAYVMMGVAGSCCYWIQEALPGEPVGSINPVHLPELLRLNRLQLDCAPKSLPRQWPHPVLDTLLYGGAGFCLHEPLRTYSHESAALLDAALRIGERHIRDKYRQDDIVHIDFNPANVLAVGDTITGVVDWDAVFAGDAAFDLATLLFYAYEDEAMRQMLASSIIERVGREPMALYLAHLIVRQVDWSIRHHGQDITERYIRRSYAILHDLDM